MKKYEMPRTEVVEIELQGAILDVSGGEIGGSGKPDANKRRNQWNFGWE